MKNYKWLALPVLLFLFNSCKKETETVDTTYPEIDITSANAFPKQCSTVARGESFSFNALLSDNQELGACSIDIHHNFDHHTHSTEVSDCGMDAVKTPVNPFLLIKAFDIPEGQKSYTINQTINVPANVDPGDYHFLIRLTDKTGWQTIKGLSIKVR